MEQFEENVPQTSGGDPRELLAIKIGKVGLIFSAIFSLIATIMFSNATGNNVADSIFNNDSLSLNAQSTFDDTWVPTGFNAWSSDSNIAWKWHPGMQCADYGCVGVDFISRDGCPNGLYAAVNWLDSPANENGNVISYDNATLPSLMSNQIAKLRFDDIEGNGKSAQMSEINCR